MIIIVLNKLHALNINQIQNRNYSINCCSYILLQTKTVTVNNMSAKKLAAYYNKFSTSIIPLKVTVMGLLASPAMPQTTG